VEASGPSTSETSQLGLNMADEQAELLVDVSGESNSAQTEAPQQESETVEAAAETAPDEVVVSIGEESPPHVEETRAPEWVRELRKSHRELQKRNRELEQKLTTVAPPAMVVDPGRKPTLESHDYDAAAYEQALASWYERKRQADEQEARQRAETQAAEAAWQAKLDSYSRAKAELKVRDYEDAEAIAQELFSVTQQGVLLQGAENPALLVYALGKNPSKAKELSSISDPVKFAFAVAKLETQLKVSQRKAPPAPEAPIKGSAPVSGAVDGHLERLRDEAARTGDMSKIMAYKRQLRAKAG